MTTTTQKFKTLVRKHGIKDVSEAIEFLLKSKQPGYIAEIIIPVIISKFNITKEQLLSSNKKEHRDVRKFLILIMKEYLSVSNKEISDYFVLNKRTLRRYISTMKKIVYASKKSIEYRFYKDFIIKTKEVINHIENKKHVR